VPIAVASAPPDRPRVLAPGSALDPGLWPGGPPPVERHFRPSLAYRLCLVAEGRFDAAFSFRDTCEWDVAAGDLIAGEAGATVTTRAGEAPRYNRPNPRMPGIIVAAPALHAALIARL
jgi:myo-inositol-1(or 4)-monophosphatase